jgi:hypothetical protein
MSDLTWTDLGLIVQVLWSILASGLSELWHGWPLTFTIQAFKFALCMARAFSVHLTKSTASRVMSCVQYFL